MISEILSPFNALLESLSLLFSNFGLNSRKIMLNLGSITQIETSNSTKASHKTICFKGQTSDLSYGLYLEKLKMHRRSSLTINSQKICFKARLLGSESFFITKFKDVTNICWKKKRSFWLLVLAISTLLFTYKETIESIIKYNDVIPGILYTIIISLFIFLYIKFKKYTLTIFRSDQTIIRILFTIDPPRGKIKGTLKKNEQTMISEDIQVKKNSFTECKKNKKQIEQEIERALEELCFIFINSDTTD